MERGATLKRLGTLFSLVLALVLVSARPSQAQLTTDPGTGMAAAPLGATETSPSFGRGFGIGVVQMLSGQSGLNLGGFGAAFDGGQFHIDGFLYFNDPGEEVKANFGLGGRFWWHLHSTANSDLSLGGGVGFFNIGGADNPGAEGATVVNIEAGAQIRAFIAQNVAVMGSAGIGLATSDGEGVLFSGHLLGSFGIIYFFQ